MKRYTLFFFITVTEFIINDIKIFFSKKVRNVNV